MVVDEAPGAGGVELVVVVAVGAVVVVVDAVLDVVDAGAVEDVVVVGAGAGAGAGPGPGVTMLFKVVPLPLSPKIADSGWPEMSSIAVMNKSAITKTMPAVPAMVPRLKVRGRTPDPTIPVAGGTGDVVASPSRPRPPWHLMSPLSPLSAPMPPTAPTAPTAPSERTTPPRTGPTPRWCPSPPACAAAWRARARGPPPV